MTTARDIIKSSLRKISQLGVGESLDPNEAADALGTLNDMLATWSVEGDMVFTDTIETFPLVSGQGEYTIGAGGDFNTGIPRSISSVYVTNGTTDYYLTAYGKDTYAAVAQKTTQSTPSIYYYDGGYPLAKIRFLDVPTSADTVTIYSEKELASFATLDTEFAMPNEYRSALSYNLAVLMAPEYEREASMTIQRQANKTKKAVSTQNSRNNKRTSSVDTPTHSRSRININSGFQV